MSEHFLLRLKNIGQLVQVSKNKELYKIQQEMDEVTLLNLGMCIQQSNTYCK
jgi:hypothetical protein